MKKIIIMHLFAICLINQIAADNYNRPLSEEQTFYIPSDALNNDVVGTVLAYPEFHETGISPAFSLKSNVDNIYAVSSTGVITIANNASLGTGDDVITVTISKDGYVNYDINVTITCISVSANTFFIDPASPVNGSGTRADPKNSIPNLNSNNGYRYWFKRGSTLTLVSQMSAMGNQTNKYFCSYGQGAQARIVGNGIRIFSVGSGCSNIIFCDLELDALNPASDGSNWLTTPIYFMDSNGSMIVSHCTISHGLSGSGTGVSIAIPGLSYLFNKIRNTIYDGLYIGKVTSYARAIGNDIDRINWAYQFYGTSESVSGGDCIQFSAAENVLARGNYCNHTMFGNKFCIIVEDGSNNRYSAEVTDNYCLAPTNNTGIYIQGYVTGSKISRNWVEGGVQGISNGGGGGTIQMDYNIIKSPSSRGIYGGSGNIYNNTLYNCPTAIYNHTAGYPAKNNIFYFTNSSQIAYNNAGSAAYDYNLYSDQHTNMFGTGRSTVAGQTGDVHSLVGNPQFVSVNDLHLINNSIAGSAGISLGLSKDYASNFIKNPPSMGAFESGSYSQSPVSPVYQSSKVENATPSLLELTYDLALANVIPATSSFIVMINSVSTPINSVAISGTKVQLTLSGAVKYGDVISISYIKPATNPLQSTSSGQAPSISAQSTINNLANPVINPTAVKITMTISPNHVHKIIYILLGYSSILTSVEKNTITPEIIRIFNTAGKLLIEKLLVTGVSSFTIPLNLSSGIYTVKLLTAGIEIASQKVQVFH